MALAPHGRFPTLVLSLLDVEALPLNSRRGDNAFYRFPTRVEHYLCNPHLGSGQHLSKVSLSLPL